MEGAMIPKDTTVQLVMPKYTFVEAIVEARNLLTIIQASLNIKILVKTVEVNI
jgi:hypothetical protein